MANKIYFQGHSSYVTCLDWSLHGQYLRSNSGDFELLHCEYILFNTNVFLIIGAIKTVYVCNC